MSVIPGPRAPAEPPGVVEQPPLTRVLLQLPRADATAAVDADPVRDQPLTRGDTVIGLDADLQHIDPDLLARLIRQAWRHRAPKALATTD